MYHLGLMKTPKEDIGRLFTLTIITAFYGLFFAIPLRKYYICKSCPASSPPMTQPFHSEAALGLPFAHCYRIHYPFAA